MFKWLYFNNTLVKNHKTLVYSLNSNVLYIVIGFWSHLTMQSVVIVQSPFNVLHVLAVYFFYFKDAEYHSLDQQTYLCKSKIIYALLKVVTKLFI